MESAKKLRVRFMCLKKGHRYTYCQVRKNCEFCSSLHHKLACISIHSRDTWLMDEQGEDLGTTEEGTEDMVADASEASESEEELDEEESDLEE